MSGRAETAVTRLWRDRAQLREQERDEAQARARIAEEKVAALRAELDRLANENARLRALLTPDTVRFIDIALGRARHSQAASPESARTARTGVKPPRKR
jgi:hypothetical protein